MSIDSGTPLKQLHIEIPLDTFKELKKILPDRGMITIVMRRLIDAYIRTVAEGKGFNEGKVATNVVDSTKNVI